MKHSIPLILYSDMEQNMSSVIHNQNIEKTCRKRILSISAVKGIRFQVQQEAFVFLAARSGSGKSPLLKGIDGLDNPSGERLIIRDKDLSTMSRNHPAAGLYPAAGAVRVDPVKTLSHD